MPNFENGPLENQEPEESTEDFLDRLNAKAESELPPKRSLEEVLADMTHDNRLYWTNKSNSVELEGHLGLARLRDEILKSNEREARDLLLERIAERLEELGPYDDQLPPEPKEVKEDDFAGIEISEKERKEAETILSNIYEKASDQDLEKIRKTLETHPNISDEVRARLLKKIDEVVESVKIADIYMTTDDEFKANPEALREAIKFLEKGGVIFDRVLLERLLNLLNDI